MVDEPEIKKLKRYDKAYAAGTPKVSDVKYDRLREAAKKLYPKHPYFKTVGAKLTDPTAPNRKEVTLPVQMGSLHKKRPKQIVAWLQKLPKNTEYFMHPKLDGVAIVMHYIDGVFHKAYTRGDDGITGYDVTENIKHVQGCLPKITRRAKHSPIKGDLFVKAECVCHESIFKKYFAKSSGGKYKNSRNFVIGQINRLKLGAENIKALNKLTLVCYGMDRMVNGKRIYHDHKMSELNQLGFHGFTTTMLPLRWSNPLWKKFKAKPVLATTDYPPQLYKDLPIQKLAHPKLEDITAEYLNEMLKTWRNDKYINLRQDGIVLEIAQHAIRKKYEFDEIRPGFAFAIKAEVEDQVTQIGTIKKRIWTLTSRKLLKPTIVLEEKLDFNGTEVERITGVNAAFVKKHNLNVGEKIRVIISGDVIPRILGNVNEKIK